MTLSTQDNDQPKVEYRYLDPETAHEAVIYTLNKFSSPASYSALIDEEPRKSTDGRLAYWQNPEKKARGLSTVTTVGRYIRRHWPVEAICDHALRDIVALHEPDIINHLTTTDEMVHAVQKGPYSCMQWEEDDDGLYASEEGEDHQKEHPYDVYTPAHGWSMYVRIKGGKIVGRCLVNTFDDTKVYVRSYTKAPEESCSVTDQQLEAYLNDKGFSKRREWPEGLRLALIPYHGKSSDCLYILPYLDPGSQTATPTAHRLTKQHNCWVRDNSGEHVAESTAGGYEDAEDDRETCESCGDTEDSDDMWTVGRQEDTRVCQHCYENRYESVLGRNAETYTIHTDRAITVDGQGYDESYLFDNDIVKLHDDQYAKQDDTVYVASEDGYYLCDDVGYGKHTDALIVKLNDDEYELTTDSFWCIVNDDWFARHDTPFVELLDGDCVCKDDFLDYIVDAMEDGDTLTDHVSASDAAAWAEDVKQELNNNAKQTVLEFIDKVTVPEGAAPVTAVTVGLVMEEHHE